MLTDSSSKEYLDPFEHLICDEKTVLIVCSVQSSHVDQTSRPKSSLGQGPQPVLRQRPSRTQQ
jgi:hypothetical protein